jgi:beta-glucosidase
MASPSASANYGDPLPDPTDFHFPPDFKWCVSTAAYQVEGNDKDSDWWQWEQIPGKIVNGEHSGRADDHWNRLEEDTQLLKDLNASAYRFSIEWAKIEPRQGVYDQDAIAHYRKELALLKAAGIEPVVTLWHFTFPEWVAAKGSWEWDGAPTAFANYVGIVYSLIAPDVTTFITLNEPTTYISAAYLGGLYPPGYTNLRDIFPPILGMLKAHAKAYHVLHDAAQSKGKTIRVGTANHLRIFDPFDPLKSLDRSFSQQLDEAFNWAFPSALQTGEFKMTITPYTIDQTIDGLSGTQDFMGVNYYSRTLVQFKLEAPFVNLINNPDAQHNDLGWEIYPEGFYKILKETYRRFPTLSILVTENGTADAKDSERPQFIIDHLKQLKRAIEDGVPVEGYCHWSIYDNFEWTNGFEARFGLYTVDYSTLKRTPRTSAKIFSRIAKENQVFSSVQDALSPPPPPNLPVNPLLPIPLLSPVSFP